MYMYLKRPSLSILLYHGIVVLPSNQSFNVSYRVGGIQCRLALCIIAKQPRFIESDAAGRHSVSLVVDDDLHFAVLEHCYARVRGPKIDPHRMLLC